MSDTLPSLLAALRDSSGIAHKFDIQRVARALQASWQPHSAHPNGDDRMNPYSGACIGKPWKP